MALVVFLRGANVGGHRIFRPSLVAGKLRDYGVVNVGAAGTFVVRKPVPRRRFESDLRQSLPFETEIIMVEGSDIVALEAANPFGDALPPQDVVRFVSILANRAQDHPVLPICFPENGEWLVRLIAVRRRFVFGMYRRHMKTIGYLGRIDGLFGGKVTTRNWNTMLRVAGIVNGAVMPSR
jgi:uncharacterized protein (DUF1697 family)